MRDGVHRSLNMWFLRSCKTLQGFKRLQHSPIQHVHQDGFIKPLCLQGIEICSEQPKYTRDTFERIQGCLPEGDMNGNQDLASQEQEYFSVSPRVSWCLHFVSLYETSMNLLLWIRSVSFLSCK